MLMNNLEREFVQKLNCDRRELGDMGRSQSFGPSRKQRSRILHICRQDECDLQFMFHRLKPKLLKAMASQVCVAAFAV